MGDSSTDPLANNVHTISSDEVILRDKKHPIEILSHFTYIIDQAKKKFSTIQISDLSTSGAPLFGDISEL